MLINFFLTSGVKRLKVKRVWIERSKVLGEFFQGEASSEESAAFTGSGSFWW
jgi:hypothetical protein